MEAEEFHQAKINDKQVSQEKDEMLSSMGALQLQNQQMRSELRQLKSLSSEKTKQEELLR